MQAAIGEDHEARFAGLQSVVAILEKATSPASGYTKESQRLLDPRYRLSFIAEDIDTASGQVVEQCILEHGPDGPSESWVRRIVNLAIVEVRRRVSRAAAATDRSGITGKLELVSGRYPDASQAPNSTSASPPKRCHSTGLGVTPRRPK